MNCERLWHESPTIVLNWTPLRMGHSLSLFNLIRFSNQVEFRPLTQKMIMSLHSVTKTNEGMAAQGLGKGEGRRERRSWSPPQNNVQTCLRSIEPSPDNEAPNTSPFSGTNDRWREIAVWNVSFQFARRTLALPTTCSDHTRLPRYPIGGGVIDRKRLLTKLCRFV